MMSRLPRIHRNQSIAPVTLSEINSASDPKQTWLSRISWSPRIPKRVHPTHDHDTTSAASQAFMKVKLSAVGSGLYHWTTCLFIIFLVCSQLLGAIWDSTTIDRLIALGRSPLLGPHQIVGTNDVPYTDRVIACVRNGKMYEPRLVSSLLAAAGVSAILKDSTGTAVHGYRLKQRRVGAITDSLDSIAQPMYEMSCNLIASTMDNIFEACESLGYSNLTRGDLHVADDWDSKNLFELPNTLPVLIMPFWDNAIPARHAISTHAGDACIFRLSEAYAGDSDLARFSGVNRTVHHERTIEWLQRPGGYWKNGWYEDLEGMRWYSDVVSSAKGDPYNMMQRVFDMRSGKEIDCTIPSNCHASIASERWGDKLSSTTGSATFSSVYIANGTEFGLFTYEGDMYTIVRSVFDWQTLLSNVYVALILQRWMATLILMFVSGFRCKSEWLGCGICCVSGSYKFAILPLASLPRLKMTLTAFWTVGCAFEGQQRALSEAWFVMYPAIAHFVLIYYSILDLLAKGCRRRISDALFPPTVMVLCLLHYFRFEFAVSGWMENVDGRVATVIFSDEVRKLQLLDFFTTDIAWRINGHVTLVFTAKVCILAIGLLPLLFARSFPIRGRGSVADLHGVERALALCVHEVSGLASSPPYRFAVVDEKTRSVSSTKSLSMIPLRRRDQANPVTKLTRDQPSLTLIRPFLGPRMGDSTQLSDEREVVFVSGYELLRLGYLVFGDNYLTSFDGWARLSAMTPLRSYFHLWNHRVLVWQLRPSTSNGTAEIAGNRALECTEPQLWRLDDPRFKEIRSWQVSACSIQC